MKIALTILALAISYGACGQTDLQNDLIDILNVALADHKLPSELIHETNPKMTMWTNAPFIVVKADSSKGLVRHNDPRGNSHVWIFDYEDIFLLQSSYGLVVLEMTKEKDLFAIKFETMKYPHGNSNMSCHSGQLTAVKKGDSWTITDSELSEKKCVVDMFGAK